MPFTLLLSFESVTGMPGFLGWIFVIGFGALVGSFLNVVIHRVPQGKSIVFPNSTCPNCEAAIKPYDNIPIVSWLILGGKCRNCKAPISFRYPAVELLTAILWGLTYWQIGFTPFLYVGIIFTTVLVALMFIDAEHLILPNAITYPFFIFAVLVRIVHPIIFGPEQFVDMAEWPATVIYGMPVWVVSLVCGLAGALAGGGSLWLIGELWSRLRGIEAMGLGDVKMMLGFGAIMGWRLSFLAIFVGAFAGALIGIAAMARRKDAGLQSQLPFGVFLGIGSVVSLLFGDKLINWYVTTFLP